MAASPIILTAPPSIPPQHPSAWERPLDNELYNPDEDTVAFFKKETGILYDDELKQHVLTVQAKAFSVISHPANFVHFLKGAVIGCSVSLHSRF